jgi:hypothetical protein
MKWRRRMNRFFFSGELDALTATLESRRRRNEMVLLPTGWKSAE